jgi:hypothetical protein
MPLRVRALLCLAILGSAGVVEAISIDAPIRRVRPATVRAKTLLETALRDSPTVQALAASIAASDLIVIVEFAPIHSGARAVTRLVTVTAHGRFLRVTLGALTPYFDQIPLLAHELQHAVELAQAPSVRDEAGMRALYARIGIRTTGPQSFETIDARRAEAQARRERAREPE